MKNGLRMLAATLTVAGLSWGAHAQQQTVRIQDYPGIVGTLTRVAVEKGYCEQAGIKCTIQVINSSPLGIQTLLAKGIDVSLGNIETALQAVQKGAELRVIASSLKSAPFMLAVGNHTPWPNLQRGYPELVKDLKGRKIGVTARGSAAEFQARLMLRDAGLEEKDVTFVAVGAPLTGYAALANAQVDALLSFLPIDGFCDVLKTCTMAVQPHKGEGPKQLTRLNNGSGAVYIVRSDYLQSNPETVKAFLSALTMAGNFARDEKNLPELLAITKKYSPIALPQGDAILTSSLANFQAGFTTTLGDDAQASVMDYLVETGQLSKRIEGLTLVVE